MGVSCSCPLSFFFDLENGFESMVANSFKLESDERNTPVRSSSFRGSKVTEPVRLQSFGSGKLSREGSLRFRAKKTQTMRFIEAQADDGATGQESVGLLSRSGSLMGNTPHSPVLDPSSPKHEAAIKLQKVYKSFRTRRKLADCAVLIEQSWWKVLDFAELKRSSISFFDIEKHETAMSRWSRARTRAAKVGKGLSQNSKAQKLALQHWLEAIDPRHRYGHNLHFYYMKWLNSQSKEPFFYWLDIGEGKEVNLTEKCPRSKLQQQCIKYLGPREREAYEVAVEDGKLLYKKSGELLDTIDEPKGCKWIFVLSTSRTLYVGKKRKGSFQHSSFLAGGATLAAGRIVADKGVLKAVWPHSGHYRPTAENFEDFVSFLKDNNVDLDRVELDSVDDEDKESVRKHMRNISSGDDLTERDQLEMEESVVENSTSMKVKSGEEEEEEEEEKEEEEEVAVAAIASTRHSSSNLTLQIPSRDQLLDRLKIAAETGESPTRSFILASPLDELLTAEEPLAPKSGNGVNISEEGDDTKEETIPEESILQRINSHKGMKSYQLGKQLSCTWSTGAGPRIGCLRDYPSGLQTHALEQVNLSPRSRRRLRFNFPSLASTPNGSNLSRASSCSLGCSSSL
ncbi:IQ domain-containing protein IQM2-like [Salvia miltiorrhiza]|uniref:IQ domain-containing protein IQM2-like n=1 Tax=Salvia miltiorrhiza TaxID=226208 RepID=UPI0025AC03DC|nr:IQ domain-containing protein IQM2-like [Salvia miltiorrhiza]